MKKVLFLLLLIFILSALWFPLGSIAAGDLENQLDQVKKEKEETSKQIEQTKQAEQTYISQIEQVEDHILAVMGELESLENELYDAKLQVQKTDLELKFKEKQLEETEKELEEKVAILNQRVSAIYKNGESNYVQVVLAADDFVDFMSRLKLMVLFAEQDARIIKEVRDKKKAVLSIKQTITEINRLQNEHKDEIEKLVAEEKKKKQDLDNTYHQKQNLLAQTISQKESLIEMEKQLAAKEEEIRKKLESLRHGNAPQGVLAWPTDGILVSGFGNRLSPIFGDMRLHTGIDIGCNSGTPIIAAEAGQVIEASYMGGYGNSILIYHGGGVATFYAHLSGFEASGGQEVSRGQVIGYVGSTGWSTGPHLHFEVRINGSVVNPMNYL